MGARPTTPTCSGPGPQLGYEFLRPIFVPPPEGPDSHPTAHLHTHWPGGREVGDPVYDQSLCSAGPMLADPAAMHELERTRLAELLAMVGPAAIVTHSAGGPGTFAVVTGVTRKLAR